MDIENPYLKIHETRINNQIEYARKATAKLRRDEDAYDDNEAVLTILKWLSDAGMRLEPDTDGIMTAARDHMLLDRAEWVQTVMDDLPPKVKAVMDAAKAVGISIALVAVSGDCNDPDCTVHNPK